MGRRFLNRGAARCLVGVCALALAASCPIQPGTNPIQALLGGPSTPTSGSVAVVFLNRSAQLVQPVVALAYPHTPPVVWVNSVAPDSWDSVLVDCGLTQLTVVGVVPTDLATGQTFEQVDYTGTPFIVGQSIVCGSTVVVEVSDASDPASPVPVMVSVRTVPETLAGLRSTLNTSPTAPGFNSGLILLRPEQIDGLPMNVTASWEIPDRFVYVLNWTLAGKGPGFGTLLECPVSRIGWGNLADSSVPAVTAGDQKVPLAAPAPLQGEAFHCGDLVTLQAEGSADDPSGVQLSFTADQAGAEVQSGQIDLFGNIRKLLSDTGFAGKLSNALATLPKVK